MTQKELAEQWKQGVQIMYRNQTKEVRIGDVVIGGDHPIAIQSMTNTRTEDVEATVEQILRLEKAGCEIIRCTVPTMEAAKAIKEIKDLKLKVQASIRGDVVRVEGKSIDDLQEAIKAIRECEFDFPVNFTNLK